MESRDESPPKERGASPDKTKGPRDNSPPKSRGSSPNKARREKNNSTPPKVWGTSPNRPPRDDTTSISRDSSPEKAKERRHTSPMKPRGGGRPGSPPVHPSNPPNHPPGQQENNPPMSRDSSPEKVKGRHHTSPLKPRGGGRPGSPPAHLSNPPYHPPGQGENNPPMSRDSSPEKFKGKRRNTTPFKTRVGASSPPPLPSQQHNLPNQHPNFSGYTGKKSRGSSPNKARNRAPPGNLSPNFSGFPAHYRYKWTPGGSFPHDFQHPENPGWQDLLNRFTPENDTTPPIAFQVLVLITGSGAHNRYDWSHGEAFPRDFQHPETPGRQDILNRITTTDDLSALVKHDPGVEQDRLVFNLQMPTGGEKTFVGLRELEKYLEELARKYPEGELYLEELMKKYAELEKYLE
eukprot:gene3227-13250_t